jgi:hypothetical protein
MYIISVLSVATSEVDQSKPFNDQLEAQNYFMDRVEELIKSEGKTISYDATFINKSKVLICKREYGYLWNSKAPHKIVELKFDPEHEVLEK